MITSDTTILEMLREVSDLRIPKPDCWARNFGRTEDDIRGMIEMVRKEREARV